MRFLVDADTFTLLRLEDVTLPFLRPEAVTLPFLRLDPLLADAAFRPYAAFPVTKRLLSVRSNSNHTAQIIPNAKNIVSTLKAPVYDPTGDHSLVYTWGITGIAYNKNYVKDVPDSWEDLWNPEYAGRLILLNDSRETIGMALKKNGFSNNSTDPAQVEKAFQDLKALAPNVLAFDTDTIKQKFIAEEAWIGTMWTGDASYTLKDNPNIGFVVPKEGATIWADTFAIPKGAKHKELAEKFINFIYDPKISAKNYEYIGYNDPNEKAQEFHSKEFKNDPMLKIGMDNIDKGEWLIDIGDALPMYDRYWTELKTAK